LFRYDDYCTKPQSLVSGGLLREGLKCRRPSQVYDVGVLVVEGEKQEDSDSGNQVQWPLSEGKHGQHGGQGRKKKKKNYDMAQRLKKTGVWWRGSECV
jgi:hypothetical protein